MSKHTPAPWVKVDTTRNGVAATELWHDDRFIATVHHHGDMGTQEAEANENLLLTAPTVLEALRNTLASLESCMAHFDSQMLGDDVRHRELVIEEAKAAIAEADDPEKAPPRGWALWHTGGGCEAWRHEMVNGGYALMTEEGGSNPPVPTYPVLLGYYDAEGDFTRYHETFANVVEAVAQFKKDELREEMIYAAVRKYWHYDEDQPLPELRITETENYTSDGPGYSGPMFLIVAGEPQFYLVLIVRDGELVKVEAEE